MGSAASAPGQLPDRQPLGGESIEDALLPLLYVRLA